MVKVGVMGGTFDPPHRGHLAIAREAWERLGLSFVIFIPAGQPWLKSETPVSSASDRFEMVRRAISPFSHFRISRIEVDRAGPSYTVDTLAELKTGLGTGSELFFLLGWDSLAQLPKWHRASEIIGWCHLVAVPRPGYYRPDIEALEREIAGIEEKVLFLEMAHLDVSATDIRNRVARGESIASLVPEPVEEYIRERGLYRL